MSFTSDSESESCATSSSSLALFWHACKSMHSTPLLTWLHWDSLHDCTHLQGSRCITAVGAGEPHIQLTAMSLPFSSVIQPQSVGFATNDWLDRQTSLDRSLKVCKRCMHGEAVLTLRELTWLPFSTSHTEQLIQELVHLVWQVVSCSFSKSSGGTSHERKSPLKASWYILFFLHSFECHLSKANKCTDSITAVKTCIPINELRTLPPSVLLSVVIFRNYFLFFDPYFWNR
jgi:hypothetical protein